MTEHSHSHPLCASAGAWPSPPGTGASLEAWVQVRAGMAPVIAVYGELDIATAETFCRLMNDAIFSYGPDVLVDASGIDFCDACGIGAIVHAANNARRVGGTLMLVSTSRRLARLLRIVGLEWRLTAQHANGGRYATR